MATIVQTLSGTLVKCFLRVVTCALARREYLYHLRTLAKVGVEVQFRVERPDTLCSLLDAPKARYPMLRCTICDDHTGERRAMLRLFACQENLSHEGMSTILPDIVTTGKVPLFIIGASADGFGRAGSVSDRSIRFSGR